MNTKRIIIHSAEEEFRALIKALIASEQLAIVEAKSREQLVRLCCEGGFDKVVTNDVRMFMNGSISVNEIRRKRSTRIFILSTDHSEHAILSLLELGVAQFLSLPIDIDRLHKKLSE